MFVTFCIRFLVGLSRTITEQTQTHVHISIVMSDKTLCGFGTRLSGDKRSYPHQHSHVRQDFMLLSNKTVWRQKRRRKLAMATNVA